MSKKKQLRVHKPEIDDNYVEFKPRNTKQEEYIRSIAENQIVICNGPAGTGKTAVAVAMAASYFLDYKVNKIILTRPVMETGISIGFLPGTAFDKTYNYIIPLLEEMDKYFSQAALQQYMKDKTIDVSPINFMRGRNFHNSFIIVDEAQNTTVEQIKMVLTRLGQNSKMIINGDLRQSDLRTKENGLQICVEKLQKLEGVATVEFCNADIIRNPIIAHILERLEK